MAKTIGTIKGPDGSDINPLEKLADAKDLAKISGGIEDIRWGSAQVFKGINDARNHKSSIIGMAQANVFEFPVFVSESVPLEYATATNTLLEQMYAAYLQMAISINPVVPYTQIRERQNVSQFSKFKTNTTKYLECVDLTFQQEACHNEITNDEGSAFEFDMISIEDTEAKVINEYLDYEPLSGFEHYFQEGFTPRQARDNERAERLRTFSPAIHAGRGGNPDTIDIPDISSGRVQFDSSNNVRTTNVRVTPGNMAQITRALEALNDARANYEVRGTLSVAIPGGGTQTLTRSELQDRNAMQQFFNNILSGDVDYEKQTTSRETIDDIMNKASNTWTNSEIDKVTKYFQAEENVRKNRAANEEINDIIGKMNRGEPVNAEEHKRLKDYYDMITSSAKAEDSGESRTARNVRGRGELRVLSNGLVSAGPAVIKQLTEKGIDIEKSSAELEKLTKELQDVDDAENTVMRWLNTDESRSGGMSVEEKRKRYGRNLRDLRAHDILNDHLIKRNQARMLQNQIDAYEKFTRDYGVSPDDFELAAKAEKEARESRKERFEHNATKAPEFIDENKIKKLNTMKPLMMSVTMSIMADDGHVSHPMEYIVGVKTHCRIIKSEMLPEIVQYPIKEMNNVTRKAKWRAGELKFFKDIVFHIKEKKQTAIDSRNPNRKWYRRLYELAHMKGDGNVSKSIAGGGATHGLIPNATIIISKSDVDHIEDVTKIDMLKPSTAKRFCEELFLSCFIVVDIDNESIKILTPDINNDFEVQSLAAVNKQIAELDTAGKSTRDIFKMLK